MPLVRERLMIEEEFKESEEANDFYCNEMQED